MNKTGFLAYNVGKMTPHWPCNLKNYTHLQFAVSENSASVRLHCCTTIQKYCGPNKSKLRVEFKPTGNYIILSVNFKNRRTLKKDLVAIKYIIPIVSE